MVHRLFVDKIIYQKCFYAVRVFVDDSAQLINVKAVVFNLFLLRICTLNNVFNI